MNRQEVKRYMHFIPAAIKLFFLYAQLRKHGVVYGKKLRGNLCIIKNKGQIELGDNVSLNSFPDGELYKTGLLTHLKYLPYKNWQ